MIITPAVIIVITIAAAAVAEVVIVAEMIDAVAVVSKMVTYQVSRMQTHLFELIFLIISFISVSHSACE